MSGGQRFYDGYHRMAAIAYVWWYLKLNLFAVAASLPLIAWVLLMDGSLVSLVILAVAGLTVGPAVYVVVAQILDLDRYDGVQFRTCIRLYRSQFWRIQKLWAPAWSLIVLALANLQLAGPAEELAVVRWISVIAIALITTFTVNTVMLMARWPEADPTIAMTVTAKLSIVRAVRFYITLLVLVGTQVLLSVISTAALIFALSVPLGLIVLNYRPVLAFVATQQAATSSPRPRPVANVGGADARW